MAFTKAGLWGPQAIIDSSGHPQPGATATLYLPDEVTVASLWTTSAKSVAVANPTQADIHANLHFWTDPGQYRLRVNVGTVVTWLDVEVPIDPGEAAQDQDVVAAQAAAEAYADGIVAAALAAALAASQPLDADLTAIAALATTAFGRALLILADAAALRAAAGLGTAATHAVGDFDAAGTAAAAVAAVVAGAPGALDTLNELATALADDANFATTVTNALATKVIAGATSGTANQAALPAAVAHTHEIVKTDDGGVYLSTGSSWVEVVPPSLKLAPTAVKTGNYTAAVGDYVLCDTSGGIFTVTLPTAPADKTSIAVDLVASGNTLTIARGGADVFQKTGGPTALTMNTANRVLVLQYQSSIAVWHVQDHLPAVINTKGDLLTYGTERARLAVGADGALLGADSTQATGLKWIPSGTYALLGAAASTPTIYVSKGAGASDANDGLASGSAKSTVAAAKAALPANGGTIRLMLGTWTEDVNLLGFASGAVTLQGISEACSVIKSATAGPVVQIDGQLHAIRDITIDGNTKAAVTGLMVRGYSANTTSYLAVRSLDVSHVKITQCKEGFRLGHYSTLNGVTGDTGDADISGNTFRDIWVDNCDYGIIQDGQNILENFFEGLLTSSITYNHVLMPRGGDLKVNNWDCLGTATAGYAKIETAAGDVAVRNVRSENSGGINATFIHTANTTTKVLIDQADITNIGVTTSNVDLNFAGGNVVLINAKIDGTIALANTNLVAIQCTYGGISRSGNQATKNEHWFDPARTKLPLGASVEAPGATLPAAAHGLYVGPAAGGSDTLALVGSGTAANQNIYFSDATKRAIIQTLNSGTNGSSLGLWTKTDGGGLVAALTLAADQQATLANGLSVATTATNKVGLLVNAITGVSVNLATFQVNGTTKAHVRNDGAIFGSSLIADEAGLGPYIAFGNATTGFTVNGRVTGQPLWVLNAQSGQTVDIEQWQINGTTMSRIGKAGRFVTSVATAPALGDLANGELAVSTDASGNLIITSRVAGALKSATVTVA